MSILTVTCLAVVCAALIIIVKDARPEFSILLSITVSAALLLFALNMISPYLSQIGDMLKETGNTQIFQTALKATGICLLSEFAEGTCADFGQSALAAKARLMGRIGLLILALPYAAKVIETAQGLIR